MMEWWMKLLPLFCVILLSLGWWGDLSVPTYIFFWSRQKSDTNMKKNSAWLWIRRIRCVSSFHRCKSWIISDVKIKNRRLIILENLWGNSKKILGFCFFLEDIYYQKIISDILLNVFVSNKKLWMILKNKFNNMENFESTNVVLWKTMDLYRERASCFKITKSDEWWTVICSYTVICVG